MKYVYYEDNGMSSLECFEEALKHSNIETIWDVDDTRKLAKVDRYLFALGLAKAMEENEDGRYLFYRGYLNSQIDSIAKYLCVFSKRTYIGAGSIHFGYTNGGDSKLYYDDRGQTPNRALKLYVAYRELFKNKIAFFAPTSGLVEEYFCHYESFDFLTPLLNSNYKKINTSDFQRVTDRMVEKVYIGLPWLKNARIEDYFELIHKYQNHFAKYSLEVKKMADASESIEKFQYDLVQSIQEAIIDLRIDLEKKRSELLTKGIVTSIGVCFTTMPLIIPDAGSMVNPEWISALLGGGALYEFFDGAKDLHDMLYLCRQNTFFPMWEWNRITEKRQKQNHWIYKEKL